QKVERPLANYLVGDVDAITFYVAGRGYFSHHWPPKAGQPATAARYMPLLNSAAAAPVCPKSSPRRCFCQSESKTSGYLRRVPAINSSSQCRPFAIAVTSLARVSARIGRGSG